MKSYRYLSFFSGALGLDLGLEKAGLVPLSANEINPTICETIRLNRPNIKLFPQDIRDVTDAMIKSEFGIKTGELFAIVGGPPCQAFSTAGRRLGLNDDRGNVFLHFIDLIAKLQPKYAVFENVRGLLSAPLRHRPHSERGTQYPAMEIDEQPGGALLKILDLLEKAGYTTTFTLYNTANFGVPQIRERLIFFASRDGSGIPYISPTHSQNGEDGLKPWVSIRKALEKLPKGPHSHSRFPETRLKYLGMLKAGQNWRNLPAEVQRKAMGESWNAGGGKTGFYRRLDWEKPSPTLVTRPTMPATTLCHPSELRPLSIEEYAAIQTFPSDFVFCGKLDEKYLQIGNAVPPKFAEHIGKHLIAFDRGELKHSKYVQLSRYRGTDDVSWRRNVAIYSSLFTEPDCDLVQ